MLIAITSNAQQLNEQNKIKVVENKIYIEAFVNGKGPFQFLFDSGATGIGRLDIKLVQALKLKDVGTIENSDGHNLKIEKLAKVDSLRVGSLKLENVDLMYRDYNAGKPKIPVDGMIGIDFFKDFLLTIDYPQLILGISNSSLSKNDSLVIAYHKPFEVSGQVGGIPCLFKIDTGSSLDFHFPESIIAQVKHQLTGVKGTAVRANTKFELTEAILKEPIWLGKTAYPNEKISYSSLATWVNVGSKFLKRHKISFDQKNKLIKIE